MKKGVSVSKSPDVSGATISAAELCEKTGLTDRRHRQLAEQGYFPKPDRAQYQREETFAGIIRYLREQLLKKDDSLRREQTRLTKAKRMQAEDELEASRGELVRAADIGPALRNISLHQRAVLQTKLETEIAPNLSGLKPAEVRARLAGAVDEICRIFQEGIKQWTETPPGNS